MIETVPITDARRRFLGLVDEVARGAATVLVTKHGRPAAILVNPDEYFQTRETLDLLLKTPEVRRLAAALTDRGGS